MDPASIQALLERHLPRAVAGCVVHGPVGAHQNSRIYRAECRDFPFPLLVKLCVHSNSTAPDPVTTKAQFLGLQQAWSMTHADAHYRVPQPVLLLEQEGILVDRHRIGDGGGLHIRVVRHGDGARIVEVDVSPFGFTEGEDRRFSMIVESGSAIISGFDCNRVSGGGQVRHMSEHADHFLGGVLCVGFSASAQW